jgi:hypothetical protein
VRSGETGEGVRADVRAPPLCCQTDNGVSRAIPPPGRFAGCAAARGQRRARCPRTSRRRLETPHRSVHRSVVEPAFRGKAALARPS